MGGRLGEDGPWDRVVVVWVKSAIRKGEGCARPGLVLCPGEGLERAWRGLGEGLERAGDGLVKGLERHRKQQMSACLAVSQHGIAGSK